MSRLISICIGTYVGVFLAQNYEIPRAPGPNELMEKFSSFWNQISNFGGKDKG